MKHKEDKIWDLHIEEEIKKDMSEKPYVPIFKNPALATYVMGVMVGFFLGFAVRGLFL